MGAALGGAELPLPSHHRLEVVDERWEGDPCGDPTEDHAGIDGPDPSVGLRDGEQPAIRQTHGDDPGREKVRDPCQEGDDGVFVRFHPEDLPQMLEPHPGWPRLAAPTPCGHCLANSSDPRIGVHAGVPNDLRLAVLRAGAGAALRGSLEVPAGAA